MHMSTWKFRKTDIKLIPQGYKNLLPWCESRIAVCLVAYVIADCPDQLVHHVWGQTKSLPESEVDKGYVQPWQYLWPAGGAWSIEHMHEAWCKEHMHTFTETIVIFLQIFIDNTIDLCTPYLYHICTIGLCTLYRGLRYLIHIEVGILRLCT